MLPEITRLAWEDKADEIQTRAPGIARDDFVFALSREEYEEQYGRNYQKPGWMTRVLFFLIKIVPKVGPLKPLAFEPLTPEAERLFVESFATASERYGAWLASVGKGPLTLANTDFDTGEPPERSDNPLMEETYRDLLRVLAGRLFLAVPPDLARDINRHYAAPRGDGAVSRGQQKQDKEARRLLAAMNASATAGE